RQRVLRQFLREAIHSRSAATAAIAAFVVWLRRCIVILALGFLRMPQHGARAIKRVRLGERYVRNRIDEFKELAIRRFLVEMVGLVANGVTLAALHPMVVVVEHFLERAAINYRLIALEAFALFSFEGFHRNRAKLDSLDGAPRIDVPLENLDSVKAGLLECSQKTVFSKGAGDAAAPKLWIVLHFFRHSFIAHNVRYHCPPAFF